MALKFKTEADYRRWLETAPRVRLAATHGETVLADTTAGEATASAPRIRRGWFVTVRLPSRATIAAACGWFCLATAYAGLLGMWTVIVAQWLLDGGFACDLL